MILSNGFLIVFAVVASAIAFFSLAYIFPNKITDFLKTDSYIKKVIATLFIFIILIVLSGLIGPKIDFFPNDEEWEEVYYARQIENSSGLQLSRHMRHGFFYVSSTIFGDSLYGRENGPAAMNMLFLLVSVLIAGISIKKLSGSIWLAIAGSLLIALNPIWLSRTLIFSGYPAMISFAFSGFILFAILSAKGNKIAHYAGMLSFAGIASAGKIEYAILFLIAIAIIALGLEKKEYKKSIFAGMMTIAMIIPSIAIISRQKDSDQFCGTEAQVGVVSENIERITDSFLVAPIESAVKKIGGWRFSLSYLMDDFSRIIQYWLKPELMIIAIMAIAGIIVSAVKKDKGAIAASTSFVLITATYAADCANYVPRFAAPHIIFAVIMAVLAISYLIRFGESSGKERYIRYAALLSGVIVIVGIMISYLPQTMKNIRFERETVNQSEMRELLSAVPDSAKKILVSGHNELMEIMTIEERNISIISLNDIFDRKDKSEKPLICFTEDDLCGNDSYFISTPDCAFFESTRKICAAAREEGEQIYSLKDNGYKASVYRMTR